jgi:DNA-binding CsgD family transcriptional regulator
MKMEDNALGIALVNQCRQRDIVTGTRAEWVRERDWQRCGYVTEYCEPLRWGESMMGIVSVSGGFRCFSFARERGDGCFSPRHAKMLELMAREIAAMPETRLAPMSADSLLQLPTRLREVLARIVEGDNEKQIALVLGISRNTVHEYIRRLYGRLGVSGRGALLARVARLLHALEFADGNLENNLWFFQQAAPASRAE